MLIGTWADASWAIRFYERHGFALLDSLTKEQLLRTYWKIPERQIETSVVMADLRGRALAESLCSDVTPIVRLQSSRGLLH